MKKNINSKKEPCENLTIEQLNKKAQLWVSEIEFIDIEQEFLKELITEHIIGLCSTNNFKKAKLYLKGLEYEKNVAIDLKEQVNNHKVNLALLMENIFLKKEDSFRTIHKQLDLEINNYTQNFKYIKKEVFELILEVMKKEKQQNLLASNK
ncbi:hypothetical protein SAMN05444411_102441 [Lutibacter oricola]|uniref:Uncharacterized protein n=1 Tax=Lutibacter oricola TaxID=762486 RepID=A0A1H2XFB6_9FLAO|nr:hypothetical protein [Lutibacter oricola]SDW90949.1 hypothetical protein SAMN05444411_102441 [Lutibacter oricola]